MLDTDLELNQLLDVLDSNAIAGEAEHAHRDPLLHHAAATIFRALAGALNVDVDHLRGRARDARGAAALERAHQRRLMFAAAVRRAR
jgi:energy-converting hydrogenase A subunit M